MEVSIWLFCTLLTKSDDKSMANVQRSFALSCALVSGSKRPRSSINMYALSPLMNGSDQRWTPLKYTLNRTKSKKCTKDVFYFFSIDFSPLPLGPFNATVKITHYLIRKAASMLIKLNKTMTICDWLDSSAPMEHFQEFFQSDQIL